MYRFIRFLFHTFFSLFVLVCGIALIGLLFEYPYTFEQATEYVATFMQNDIYVMAAGAALMLIALLYMAISIPGRRKESFLKYNTTEGEILISAFAVEDFIKKVSRSFREIKDAYPSVTLKGKDSVEINLKLKIWAGVHNLPFALEDLQKEIRNQIQNMLGIENIHAIHIFLAKDSFAPRDIPIKRRSMNSEPEEQQKPASEVPSVSSHYTVPDDDSRISSEDSEDNETEKEKRQGFFNA